MANLTAWEQGNYKAVGSQHTFNCARAPPAQALAKTVTPGSPILLLSRSSVCVWHMWHIKRDCQAWRTRARSLKAWDQDSEASSHLQPRHCPTGAGLGQSRYTGIADLIYTKGKRLQRHI